MIDRYSGLAEPNAYSLGKEFAYRIAGTLKFSWNVSGNLRGPTPPMPPPQESGLMKGVSDINHHCPLKPENEMVYTGYCDSGQIIVTSDQVVV